MKYTVARVVFVASVAAIVGVFAGIIVYFSLVAALMVILLATAVAVAVRHRRRRRTATGANVTFVEGRPVKAIKADEHTRNQHAEK